MNDKEWIIFREAEFKDREFILMAHKEINAISGLNDTSFQERIDKDLFEDKVFKSIIAEIDGNIAWMILYSYIYWANCGKWIYLSQAYVKSEYRNQGIYKKLLKELEIKECGCNFITDLIGLDNDWMQNVLKRMNFKSSDLITYYKIIRK